MRAFFWGVLGGLLLLLIVMAFGCAEPRLKQSVLDEMRYRRERDAEIISRANDQLERMVSDAEKYVRDNADRWTREVLGQGAKKTSDVWFPPVGYWKGTQAEWFAQVPSGAYFRVLRWADGQVGVERIVR